MTEVNFEVSKSRKGLVGIILAFGLCGSFFIIGTILNESRMRILGIIASIIYFAICSFAVLSVFLFKVQAVDSTIFVRTDIGRCFRLYISDITRIACDVAFENGRQIEVITIETTTRKFRVRQTMNEFQEMAGYILEKLESGEMNEAAVSVDVKSRLIKCRNEKSII
jgi:hypothetical protein